jgi:hypothetical protein
MPIERERLDEMIKLLGCDPSARIELEDGIERSFEWFRRYDAWFARENRVAMLASARAIAECTAALCAELETAPEPLRDFLLLPPGMRILRTRADIDARRGAVLASAYVLLGTLRTMHSDCEKLLAEAQPETRGPERNRAQGYCLRLAYILIKRYSDHPINGNRDGSLLRFGSLLYEELTGCDPVDLSRPYQDLLSNPPPVTAQARDEQVNHLQAQLLEQSARDEEN